MPPRKCAQKVGFPRSGHKYQAGFGVIIWGQNPLTFMIAIYSTNVLNDIVPAG